MKASEDRITSLCSSLGTVVDGNYIEMPDCQINFEELAYSIWKDDEALKNVSILVYNLRTFEDHFIKLIFSENPAIGFIALKALAACTYPFSSNVNNLAKMNEIYQHYKYVLVSNKQVLFQALTYVLQIIRNPRSKTEDFQKAEVGFTFIRNVAVIKSASDVSESLFNILNEGGLFDIIAELQMKAFSSRIPKFAPIIAGILYGSFTPFLPLERREIEEEADLETNEQIVQAPKQKEDPELDLMLKELRQTKVRTSSRHGHWNATVFVGNQKTKTGFTHNGPITPSLLKSAPLPKAIIKTRTRPRLFTPRAHGVKFTKDAEAAAAKVLWSQAFECVFTRVLPRSFSAYDRTTTATQQLQMADLTRFFLEFILKYGGERRASPLATEQTVKFYLTMANWYTEQRIPDLEGTPIEVALHRICLLFSSFCEYFTTIIKFSDNESDVKIAKNTVSEYAKDFENFMVTLLCNKLKSKATLNMIQDTIVALDRLYRLYAVAEDERLSRRRSQPDDLSTNETMEEVNDMFATYEDFNAEMIIVRLVRRTGVLVPFFQCIKNYEKLNDEELSAITTMLNRFINYRIGLAHVFKLPYFIIIDKLLNDDKKFQESEEPEIVKLREVLNKIVEKFFFNAQRDSNVYISVLVGPDDDDLYDERRSRMAEEELYDQMGLTQKERAALNGKEYSSYSSDEEMPAPKPKTPRKPRTPKKKVAESPKLRHISQESDNSDENDDELELDEEEPATKKKQEHESDESLSDEETSSMPKSIKDEFSDEDNSEPKKLVLKKDSSSSSSSDSDDDDKLTNEEILKQMAQRRTKAQK